MANSNSSTSLYSFTNTVKVSANNFTTLYNATPSTVDVANVSDRNFTTLYNKQAEINPTRPYGNANVEAFLNIGHDSGGNVVQNIISSGNISTYNISANGNLSIGGTSTTSNLVVGTSANLGLVGNVHVFGGGPNYYLTTDGGGTLSWTEPNPQFGNAVPIVHFDVIANANNQTFSNSYINAYANNTVMNVMKNGVGIEYDLYSVSGNTLTVNIPLAIGDTIDILSTQASNGGSDPGGNIYAVQFNDGANSFAGDSANFAFTPTYNQFGYEYAVIAKNLGVPGNVILGNNIGGGTGSGSLSTSGNISAVNISSNNNIFTGSLTVSDINGGNAQVDLGAVGNVHITGGSANYLLQTNGAGVLSWVAPSTGAATSLNATLSNVHISGGTNGYVLQTDGTGNLSWTAQTGGGGGNGVPGGANTQIQYNDAGNFAGNPAFTFDNITELVSANSITTTNKIVPGTVINNLPSSSGNTNKITLDTSGVYPAGLGAYNSDMWFSVPNDQKYTWYINGIEKMFLTNNPSQGFRISDPWGNLNFYSGNLELQTGGSAGVIFAKDASLTGNIVAANLIGGNIIGDGSNLTNISGSNVTGWVSNANYSNISGSTYSVDGANVSGVVANATYAVTAGSADTVAGANVTGYVPNADYATLAGSATIVAAGNIVGTVNAAVQSTYADYANSVTLANVVGAGNIASINISGSNTDVLYGNGVFGVFTVPPGGSNSQIQFNNNGVLGGVGTMTYDIGANTLSGTFTSITSLGNLTVQRAFEKYTPTGTGLAGTFNYDAITQSIVNITANATANATVNFRGNSTISMNTLLSTNQAITLVLLSKVGTTPYIVTTLQVDGTTVTPSYLGGLSPLVGTRQSNSIQSYTFTLLKSAANTYTVLGSFAEFV